MSFHVGQKVVCVNDGVVYWRGNPDLRRGEIYTIRQITMEIDLNLWLVGVSGGWVSTRFRPVVDDTKKISFTEGAPKDSEKWDNRKRQKARA